MIILVGFGDGKRKVINLLRKLTSAYVCKNPTQYIGNDRYTEYLENMYESYPITREGKAIYVYAYYEIYFNKLEISSIITSMLPEYTYDVMVSQEKAAGVEKSNGYYITSFIGGDKVTDITVSDGVSFIANGAFSDAVSLQSINVGNGVTTIATSAFLGCTSLRTVYIGENVSTIHYKAFSGCTALESVTFADTEGWQHNVTDPAENAKNLKETYCLENWYKATE